MEGEERCLEAVLQTGGLGLGQRDGKSRKSLLLLLDIHLLSTSTLSLYLYQLGSKKTTDS